MQKKLIFIILLFSLALSACSNPNNKNKSDEQSKNTAHARIEKNYNNTKYNYSFKYYDDIYYVDPNSGFSLGPVAGSGAQEMNPLFIGLDFDPILSIYAGLEMKEKITQEIKENKYGYDQSEVTVNNIKFKKYSLKNKNPKGYNQIYLFEDAQKFLAIRFIDKPLANEIISTFEFIK